VSVVQLHSSNTACHKYLALVLFLPFPPDMNQLTNPYQRTNNNTDNMTPCDICMKDKIPFTFIRVDTDRVCQDCFDEHIKPKFLDALRFEHSYPVRWGTSTLEPQSFLVHLSKDYLETYSEREKEYKVLPAQRMYCKHRRQATDEARASSSKEPNKASEQAVEECGHYFGTKAEAAGQTFVCEKCKGLTCGTCIEPHPW